MLLVLSARAFQCLTSTRHGGLTQAELRLFVGGMCLHVGPVGPYLLALTYGMYERAIPPSSGKDKVNVEFVLAST